MNRQEAFEAAQREWLAQGFDGLTHEIETMTPSRWAETRRYLPPSVTPMPGYFDFAVTPYMREILDCMSVDSPVREIALMKGAQIAATTALLENSIGYFADHVKTAPVLMVTADDGLALIRLEANITPMFEASDMMHLIQSADSSNNRKTGKTNKKIEWQGGGSLIPFGAQNANKMRMISAQVLLNDEVDGWPITVGKDGDPVLLVRSRAKAYEGSRKVLDMSTPLVEGQSKIEVLYKRGDQRLYMVRCLRCGHSQSFRWRRENDETGLVTGIQWETEGGRLVVDSVRYLCENCAHPHTNSDKTRLMAERKPATMATVGAPQEGNAEWEPTAIPLNQHIRSYHLSALYSPVGMQSWEVQVQEWLEAWDVEKNRSRDNAKLQVFYNNVLGRTFKLSGEGIRFESVSAHRRAEYRFGEVPNKFALAHCGSEVLIVVCVVDVHKASLDVAVWGWCVERRNILIDYYSFEGDTEQLDDADTWGKLRELIEQREYVADDGKRYTIRITLIDSGYSTDTVYLFCGEYSGGVYPVKGLSVSRTAARVPEFTESTTPSGTVIYGITVDLYKDRWSSALRRGWDGIGLQPDVYFNAPSDVTDKQLKELTAETKVEKIEKGTGARIGWEWKRKSGARNELWDLLVYGNAAIDLVAWNATKLFKKDKFDSTDWFWFWTECRNPDSKHCNFYTEG